MCYVVNVYWIIFKNNVRKEVNISRLYNDAFIAGCPWMISSSCYYLSNDVSTIMSITQSGITIKQATMLTKYLTYLVITELNYTNHVLHAFKYTATLTIPFYQRQHFGFCQTQLEKLLSPLIDTPPPLQNSFVSCHRLSPWWPALALRAALSDGLSSFPIHQHRDLLSFFSLLLGPSLWYTTVLRPSELLGSTA